jgi:hypothetical protein
MTDPFDALGLPARPDLDDETVRAAWRSIAAATHPDRPDGGDIARYTAAASAYAALRTPWARSEAYADLAEQADLAAATTPLPAVLQQTGRPPLIPPDWPQPRNILLIPERIRYGRPLRLTLRATTAVLLSLLILRVIPGQPAEPAIIGGLIIWFARTCRADLAPPPGR